jgi:uncharacterized protein (TIGR00730 family)
VTAVLGPGAMGVVVATPDQEAARRDRVWLEDAHIAAATLDDLGLTLRQASGALTGDFDERMFPAMHWAQVTRRPAIVDLGEAVYVQGPETGMATERAEALEAVEAALAQPRPRRVAVFGGAWTAEDEPDYNSARTLGRGLAEATLGVVCGGYQGIMAAVCRGHTERHLGVTLGVTMEPWADRVPVNEWLTHEVVARDLFARLPLITDAEAWVAFPGGGGTLQEVALCWNLVQNGLADPRPLVVVGDRWKRLAETFRDILIVSDPAHLELITHVSTAEEALVVVRKDSA